LSLGLCVRFIKLTSKFTGMDRQQYQELIRRDPSAALWLEYHPPSRHQGEYWRALPRHVVDPTPAVLKARLFFAEKNYSSFGVHGKRRVDGIDMPPCCQVIQTTMKGKRFSLLSTREKRFRRTVALVDALRSVRELGIALRETARALNAA